MFTFKSQKKELNPKSIFFFWILVISLNFEGYKNEPWLNITNAFLSLCIVQFSSLSRVQPFALPHGLQYTRLPCPSPTPGVYSNSCPLSQWCHPTISSSVVPSPFRLQSFPASESFKWVSSSHPMAKVLEFQLQHQSFQCIMDWFPLGWTGWISLQSKGLSRLFSNTTVLKHQLFGAQLSL